MWSLSFRLNYLPPLQLDDSYYILKSDAENATCASNLFLSLFEYRHLFFMWGQLAALSCSDPDEITRVRTILNRHIKPRSTDCTKADLNCNFSKQNPQDWIIHKLFYLNLEPLDSYCIFEWGITSTEDTDFFSRHGFPRGDLLQTVDL